METRLAIFLFIVNCVTITESKSIHFASPLKALTLKDEPPTSQSPRQSFLAKFKSGIEAERRLRKAIAAESKLSRRYEQDGDADSLDNDPDEDFFESSKWAELSKEKYDTFKQEQRARIGDAFEEGFQAEEARLMEAEQKKIARTSKSPKSNNEYQFVGVVQPKDKQVKWYARPKPKNSSWSVRVVNVDKAAILRDMFVRGKVDIYGEYQNKGLDAATIASASAKTKKSSENEEEVSKVPLIQAEYTVKERSWKTLWNFSPKAFFTDRSGNYWRQRRLTPGVYTDGAKVYQTCYHYTEGRNGMRTISDNLEEYLDRNKEAFPSVSSKESLLEKVHGGEDRPDLVLEY